MKSKEIEASEEFIKDILSCSEFPIVAVKSYKTDAFILDYHIYKTAWTLYKTACIGEKLGGVMESTNLVDKQAAVV